MVAPIVIAGKRIGPGEACLIIAEAGVNHNGDIALAERLIDAAKDAGADAVKFQTFRAERLVTRSAPIAEYQRTATGNQESQFEMLKRLELSDDAHHSLKLYAEARGIIFLSTPFDEESADFLEKLGVPAFKISSGEITNLDFLAHLAKKGKPLILSTGMATMEEVQEAVGAIKQYVYCTYALLQCVSNYPADPHDTNLRAMETMRNVFKCAIGYSDHTLGLQIPLAAVALGANIIEKHLTLDRSLIGPDHKSSADPETFKSLVASIRMVEKALGNGLKRPAAAELSTADVARRSLVAARSISAGETIQASLVNIRRPGTGLAPKNIHKVVGKKARVAIAEGTLLTWDLLV